MINTILDSLNAAVQIKFLAHHYGFEGQFCQMGEEVGEVFEVLNKIKRLRDGNYRGEHDKDTLAKLQQNLIGEIADVEIMMMQMLYLAGCDDREAAAKSLSEAISFKLDRQVGIIIDEFAKKVAAGVMEELEKE